MSRNGSAGKYFTRNKNTSGSTSVEAKKSSIISEARRTNILKHCKIMTWWKLFVFSFLSSKSPLTCFSIDFAKSSQCCGARKQEKNEIENGKVCVCGLLRLNGYKNESNVLFASRSRCSAGRNSPSHSPPAARTHSPAESIPYGSAVSVRMGETHKKECVVCEKVFVSGDTRSAVVFL